MWPGQFASGRDYSPGFGIAFANLQHQQDTLDLLAEFADSVNAVRGNDSIGIAIELSLAMIGTGAVGRIPKTGAQSLAGSFGERQFQLSRAELEGVLTRRGGVNRFSANEGAGFYVSSGGVVVLSTGYRAVGGPAVDEIGTGVISPRDGGSYITFDDIRNLSPDAAQSLLQTPYPPSHWVEFDTLPLLENLRIPNGNWQRSTIPEPLTNTFPNFGAGGGTQAITDQPIIVRDSGKLPVGGGE